MKYTVVYIKAGVWSAQGKLKRNGNKGFRKREADPLQGAGLLMSRAWAPAPTTLHVRSVRVEHGCI